MRMMPNKPKTFEFPKQQGGGSGTSPQPGSCGTPGLDRPHGEGSGPSTRPGGRDNPAGFAPGFGPGPGNGPAANGGCFNTTDSFNPSKEAQSGASEASSGSFQDLLKSMQAS